MLELIASGRNNEATAAALGVAAQTVRNHIVRAREQGIIGG